MTRHEILSLIDMAEQGHKLPAEEGGHGGPLHLTCLFEMLAQPENRKLIFYPPSMIRFFIKRSLPIMADKGWLTTNPCGHLGLTDAGRAQLAQWDERGCAAHKPSRGPTPKRLCAAPLIRKRFWGVPARRRGRTAA